MIAPFILFIVIALMFWWFDRDRIHRNNISGAVIGISTMAGIMTLVISLGALMLLSCTSFMYTNEYRQEARELCALKNTTESHISGSFFLAGGYLEGSTTPCYYYLEKDSNGGLSLNKVAYYDAQIFFLPNDTTEKPSITYFWRVCERRFSPWIILLPAYGELHNQMAFKFHIKVPQGSVDSQFQIKL